MTGKEFVKHCFDEKEFILKQYFSGNSESSVGELLSELIRSGADREQLRKLVDTVMTDSIYTILLGLDGAASLGGEQVTYKLYDEDGSLLNECGELEESAYEFFIGDEE